VIERCFNYNTELIDLGGPLNGSELADTDLGHLTAPTQ
jgi:hypothetical protein